jgi:hypothetical protein
MRTYGVPIKTGHFARVRVGEYLEVDDGFTTIMWTLDGNDVYASSSCNGANVSNELGTTMADLTALPKDAAEPFMRLWLSERLGVSINDAIEELLVRSLPSLELIYQRNSGLKRVAKLSPRLYGALCAGETPREIARCYWGDDATRSDGNAFIDGLIIGDEIDESRVALMGLVPPGDQRRKIAFVATPKIWMVPPREVKDVTNELSPAVALKFAEVAIKDPRSRLQLSAASALCLHASGHDGEIAYQKLLDEILQTELAAPRSILERFVAAGPIRNQPVSRVTTATGLKALARTANNCLSNPAFPWHSKVLQGEIALMSIGRNQEISAIVAIDPKSGEILEMKGKKNAYVDPVIAAAIATRIIEVRGSL